MPAVKCDQTVLNKLCMLVGPSVVTVNGYNHRKYKLDFMTGFIVHSNERRTLVCVHKSVMEEDRKWKSLYVHFSDGAIEKAQVFLKQAPADYVVLATESTGGLPRIAVSFSKRAPRREDVITVAEIDGDHPGLNFITGTICCPSCKANDVKTSKMIVGSKDICAMTCAAVRWPHDRKTKDQVTGAAVFDMVDGLLIATIKSLDPDVYDLKYASHAYCWADKLERSLKAKDRMISISKGKKASPKQSEGNKRERFEDNEMGDQLNWKVRRAILETNIT